MLDSRPTRPIKFRQPRQALQSRAFSLEALEQWALDRTSNLSAERFRLTSFWYLDFIIQHTPKDRKTRYTASLAQSDNYGIAFSLASTLQDGVHTNTLRDADHTLVGEDSRALLIERRYRTEMDRTALIDLVIGHTTVVANDQVVLDQERPDKYALKSRLFADEADLLLKRKGLAEIKASTPHILVIGAMAGTHAALIARGFEVTATDMSPAVVGQNLGGVTVRDGIENHRLIEAADLVIITGMTLPNGTLPDLIETARINNTSTMIWAVTGRNCGHYYIQHGIDCVISDPLPFLMLPGPARIATWRREC